MNADAIRQQFFRYVRENGLAERDVTLEQSFDEAGFDSVMLMMMVVHFETECGLSVDFDLLQVDKDSTIAIFLQRIAEANAGAPTMAADAAAFA